MAEDKTLHHEQTEQIRANLASLRQSVVTSPLNWDDEADYSPAEAERMRKLYEGTMTALTEQQIVMGTVIAVDDREVVVNVGFKSEGIVPRSEFRDLEIKPGDKVEVYLETIENKQGQMLISRRLANSMRTWERINQAMDDEIVMTGIIKRRTKGGFVVDLEGIEAFLPGSQIDVKPIRDYDAYVGQRMEFKIVKINHIQNNVVISHKALIEKDLEAQKAEIINNLERGQVLEGTVKNITTFGVFIDLGGVDGLLHITDISWGRISSPEEVLHLDQKLNVVVLDFDDQKKRISLGLKQLEAHPWEKLPENITVGSRITGKIVTIADYGIFVEVMPGVEGLVHVSEMTWSQHPKSPYELYKVGDEIEAVVITLDKEERKMSLGIKQLSQDPWEVAAQKYPVGSRHSSLVRNITNYGLFVELEEGIDGFVHVQDLSWSKKINHPSEFIQKDEQLEVMVLELNMDERKIRLGHKQLTEDPWETLESVFPVDSVHQATIVKMTDKGAILELEYGVEGFVPSKNLKTENGKPELKEGDQAEFKVIEFSKDLKKIILSHTKVWKDLLPESDSEAPKAKKATTKKKKDSEEGESYEPVAMPKVEKETLGSIGALAGLKASLIEQEKATVETPPAEETKAEE